MLFWISLLQHLGDNLRSRIKKWHRQKMPILRPAFSDDSVCRPLRFGPGLDGRALMFQTPDLLSLDPGDSIFGPLKSLMRR